jgi:hypothetical protein
MTATADAPKFAHTVSQKMDASGGLPIWYWRVQRGSETLAFGECRSERQAVSAAQVAEQNYGSGLKVDRDQP